VSRYLGVPAVLGDGELPAAQRSGATFVTGRQRRDVEHAGDRAVSGVAEAVRVRPVAHEGGVPGLPHVAGFFFAEAGHPGRRDRSDPTGGALDGGDGGGVVDVDDAVGTDDRAAAVRVDPLDGVTREALVRVAL